MFLSSLVTSITAILVTLITISMAALLGSYIEPIPNESYVSEASNASIFHLWTLLDGFRMAFQILYSSQNE